MSVSVSFLFWGNTGRRKFIRGSPGVNVVLCINYYNFVFVQAFICACAQRSALCAGIDYLALLL